MYSCVTEYSYLIEVIVSHARTSNLTRNERVLGGNTSLFADHQVVQDRVPDKACTALNQSVCSITCQQSQCHRQEFAHSMLFQFYSDSDLGRFFLHIRVCSFFLKRMLLLGHDLLHCARYCCRAYIIDLQSAVAAAAIGSANTATSSATTGCSKPWIMNCQIIASTMYMIGFCMPAEHKAAASQALFYVFVQVCSFIQCFLCFRLETWLRSQKKTRA